jgi:F0F1-type ATP synthase assembly protein I
MNPILLIGLGIVLLLGIGIVVFAVTRAGAEVTKPPKTAWISL